MRAAVYYDVPGERESEFGRLQPGGDGSSSSHDTSGGCASPDTGVAPRRAATAG